MARDRLSQALLALAVAALAALTALLWQRERAAAYSAAVARQDWTQAADYGGLPGGFARAYALQQQGELQQALIAYSELDRAQDGAAAVRYNMANAYLRRAVAVERQAQRDLALPLVELAKQTYRELLAERPNFWDAKYNLERALQLFPDPQEQALQEWLAPERGPRAIMSIQAEQELP